MKKFVLIPILLFALIVLSACSSTGAVSETNPEAAAVTNSSSPTYESVLTADYEGALPPTSQVVVGMVNLDETAQAITADQAKTLLSLWKAVRSLGESETAAPEEITALFRQIEGTFTAEQLQAIAGMNLTVEDMRTTAEAMGIEFAGTGERFGEITPEMRATMEAMRESGQFPGPEGGFGGGPGGGGPGGFGGGPGGGFGGGPGGEFGGLSPEQRETAIAERGGVRGARTGVNTFILEMAIQYLEGKIQP